MRDRQPLGVLHLSGERGSSNGVADVGKHGSLNVVDLFSGVGGLSLGAARAGLTVSGAVDIDPKANDAHKTNFPSAVHLEADIADLSGSALRQALHLNGKGVAGIVGGPPCQGFSSIGRRDKDDTRNRAFVDFFRIVSEVLPKFFLVENVPGIMHDTYDELRDEAFSLVDEKYEILPPLHLSANDYGAATNRRRVFFIGYLIDYVDSLTTDSFKAPGDVESVCVKDALHGLPTAIDPNWQKEEQGWQVVRTYGDGNFNERLHGHVPLGVGNQEAINRLSESNEVSGFLGTAHTDAVAKRYAETECGKYDSISKSYRLDPDGLCPTLRAGTGPDQGSFQAVRPIHPTEARVITPREAARLQGFPDWFQFSPTKWHSFRQIGNSVSPILAEHIFGVVAGAIKTERKGQQA